MLYEVYLSIIFIVKMLFLGFWIKNKLEPTELSKQGLYYSEKVFTTLMSLLIIYLFHPNTPNPTFVTRETKLFLFIFSILTMIHTFA
jgi:hypothetical protein